MSHICVSLLAMLLACSASAGQVQQLYPSTPIAERPNLIEGPLSPEEIRTWNEVFGTVSALRLTTHEDDEKIFSAIRWPCILKAISWAKATASSPQPVQAVTLIPKLKAVFAQEGVPAELAWIAEVESRFDPDAISRSGARGLYQFMPATAEEFGLISEAGDQRNVPELSARAAARYLARLYCRFKDWPLALAAYNAGEGRVGRLLKKHQAGSFAEIAPYLPPETQVYIPKIMTTLALRENTRLGALPSPSPAVSPTLN